MALEFRLADKRDYERLEKLVIDSFEPITWLKTCDEVFGPLNGLDWRQRWKLRFQAAFNTQIVLVGEAQGEIVAYASGTYDEKARLGFIDLLAVDRRYQGKGYGRTMLRGMLEHLKGLGAEHAHLECLADNEAGNALYRSEGWTEMAQFVRWFIKIP